LKNILAIFTGGLNDRRQSARQQNDRRGPDVNQTRGPRTQVDPKNAEKRHEDHRIR
jgi:hypothetical protein